MVIDPKISVVLAVFNGQESLNDTLASLLNQEFQDFEIIAVNDGSTDATASCLNTFKKDPRVKIINQAHSGLTRALIASIFAFSSSA